MTFSEKPIYCICGHYGVGKTNVSVALAKELQEKGAERVTLLDFDIVNPYFRSADNAEELKAAGIEVILPEYANSNVDIPVLPPQVASVFEQDKTAVFDVGGDDSGAVALGGYSARIREKGYELWVVVNQCRPYIRLPGEALNMIRAIEAASGLQATGIINNTNLGEETTPEILRASFSYAAEICRASSLPLVATTCFAEITEKLSDDERASEHVLTIESATKKIF